MQYTKRIRKAIAKERVNVILGLDPSLVGFGVSVFIDGALTQYKSWTDKKGLQKKNRHSLCYMKLPRVTESNRANRASILLDWIKGYVDDYLYTEIDGKPVNLYAAMEGYAFNVQSRGASDIHELCGLIKHLLFTHEVPLRIYDPLSVKLAWAGTGTATKEDMVDVAERQFEIDLEREEAAAENIADAILIGALLQVELEVRAGVRLLKDLDESFRRVLLRVTKTQPEALISRNMLHATCIETNELIMSK
jgi:Holliday junction resolvasome RuvABC endonuclease subunit